MRLLAAAVLSVVLAGCASAPSSHALAEAAFRRGDLQAAERHLLVAVGEGNDGAAWNDLGRVYGKQGREAEAIRALTMAARYGNPTAQANLMRANIPVPPADLARAAPSDGGSAAGAFLGGLVQGRNGGRSIDCTTLGVGGGTAMTSCR